MEDEARESDDGSGPKPQQDEEAAALSDWLTRDLQVPRTGSVAPEDEPIVREPTGQSESDGPTTLEPQVVEADGLDEAFAALALLRPEERARRATARRRIVAVVAAGTALAALALLVRERSPSPSPSKPELARAAPSEAAPAPPDPQVVSLEARVIEVEPESEPTGAITRRASGRSATTPNATEDEAVSDVHRGPSVGRFPDLPRDVLLELERAAEIERLETPTQSPKGAF